LLFFCSNWYKTTENDIVGGTDPIRRRLIKLFYQLEKHHKSNGANGSLTDGNVEWFALPESIIHPKINGSLQEHDPSSNDDNELQLVTTSSNLVDYDGVSVTPSTKMIIEEPEDSIGLL
jgi:hypothetical protein